MKTTTIVVALVAAGVIAVGGYGLYETGMRHGMTMAPASAGQAAPAAPGGANSASGRKVLYWHDPMVPGQRFDKPGKSPFMDMQLSPVYADEGGDGDGGISISSRMQQNLGVRTAEVKKGSLGTAVEAVGNVAYNDRDMAVVQARSNGYIERLYVRAMLDPVKKGQALAELYVPDWVAAQEEYLSVKRMGQAVGTDGLLDAARQRMRLSGMTDDQIRLVESTGKSHARLTIVAPIGGVISELNAREGMTVMNGAPLFRINGLRTVWVNAEVPEVSAALVRPGSVVKAHTPALPDKTFDGKVSAILPEINTATRTIKARIELANPTGELVPGMFATVDLRSAVRNDVLLVPSESVIETGTRSIVMVEQGKGHFQPVEVEIGAESNGQTEIRKGLQAGQKVVASGQFLIDSEASLKGVETRMESMPGAAVEATTTSPAASAGAASSATATAMPEGVGKVESINADEITISHGPIKALQWGAMTMGFKLPEGGLPKTVATGSTVSFKLRALKDGAYQIAAIAPVGSAPPVSSAPAGGNDSIKSTTGGMHMPGMSGAAK